MSRASSRPGQTLADDIKTSKARWVCKNRRLVASGTLRKARETGQLLEEILRALCGESRDPSASHFSLVVGRCDRFYFGYFYREAIPKKIIAFVFGFRKECIGIDIDSSRKLRELSCGMSGDELLSSHSRTRNARISEAKIINDDPGYSVTYSAKESSQSGSGMLVDTSLAIEKEYLASEANVFKSGETLFLKS